MADTVESIDEAFTKSLRQHAAANGAEIAQREADEQRREREMAGRKRLIESAQNEHFLHGLGVLLQLSRWHGAITSERQAVQREAEGEANERDYHRDRALKQQMGDAYASQAPASAATHPLLRSVAALRAKLAGRG